jgi:hypothetical protein
MTTLDALVSRMHHERSPEYIAYFSARGRCMRNREYKKRNIQFLFTSFTQWVKALGKRPSPSHSVDRIDDDGPYAPDNVRWATWSEQMRNRRPRSEKSKRKASASHKKLWASVSFRRKELARREKRKRALTPAQREKQHKRNSMIQKLAWKRPRKKSSPFTWSKEKRMRYIPWNKGIQYSQSMTTAEKLRVSKPS